MSIFFCTNQKKKKGCVSLCQQDANLLGSRDVPRPLVWVFSGLPAFLPHSHIMRDRLIEDPELSKDVKRTSGIECGRMVEQSELLKALPSESY